MGKQILIMRTDKLFAVREEQRCCSRRAARSFAKGSAVVRERQHKWEVPFRENTLWISI